RRAPRVVLAVRPNIAPRAAPQTAGIVPSADCILVAHSYPMGTLEFIPATAKVLRLLSEEPAEFVAEYGVRLHELSQSVAQHSLAFLKSFAYETRPEFLGYLVIDSGSQQHVGMCSFKGPPVEGVLEIAYFTFPG